MYNGTPVIELSANSVVPTAPAPTCLLSIWSLAIFAEVTWLAS